MYIDKAKNKSNKTTVLTLYLLSYSQSVTYDFFASHIIS